MRKWRQARTVRRGDRADSRQDGRGAVVCGGVDQERGGSQETGYRARGTDGKPVAVLAIPATLQEALLARLDRLSTARQIAQLGATLGREFSYELLHAVAPISEADLQTALAKLVEAEILYQRGVGEQARYFFKHALIQDTAYQSLLKSTRQQYHQQIAQVLEERFPDTKETPTRTAGASLHRGRSHRAGHSVLATGRAESQSSARPMWKRSVISPKGWSCSRPCQTRPSAPSKNSRCKSPWVLPLIATKGWAAPEVEQAYTRARELCQQVGETPQLFPVLFGLWQFYLVRGRVTDGT